jgi:hypothetical protein
VHCNGFLPYNQPNGTQFFRTTEAEGLIPELSPMILSFHNSWNARDFYSLALIFILLEIL